MQAKKVLSIIITISQQNLKMDNSKSKEQSTMGLTWKKSNRKKEISKYLSIITRNVNGLHSLIKRQVASFNQKAKSNNLLSTRNIPHNHRHTQTKSERSSQAPVATTVILVTWETEIRKIIV
jgi:hypothetical protein